MRNSAEPVERVAQVDELGDQQQRRAAGDQHPQEALRRARAAASSARRCDRHGQQRDHHRAPARSAPGQQRGRREHAPAAAPAGPAPRVARCEQPARVTPRPAARPGSRRSASVAEPRANGRRPCTSADAVRRRVEVQPERQHQDDAGGDHQHEPDDRVAAPAGACRRRASRSTTPATTRIPAATGYDHELIAYSAPIARPVASASAHRAPHDVAARAGERDLQREGQREHGERQRQHVGVQVAEDERERTGTR